MGTEQCAVVISSVINSLLSLLNLKLLSRSVEREGGGGILFALPIRPKTAHSEHPFIRLVFVLQPSSGSVVVLHLLHVRAADACLD